MSNPEFTSPAPPPLPLKARRRRQVRASAKLRPCDRCQTQHLKCVYTSATAPCQRCQHSRRDCVQGTKNSMPQLEVSKFRHSSESAVHTATVARKPQGSVYRQAVLSDTLHTPFSIPSNPNNTCLPSSTSVHDICTPSSYNNDEDIAFDHIFLAHCHVQKLFGETKIGAFFTDVAEGAQPSTQSSLSQFDASINPYLPLEYRSKQPTLDPVSTPSTLSTNFSPQALPEWTCRDLPRSVPDSIGRSSYVPPTDKPQAYLETFLLRYFQDELASWFDLCDSGQNFAKVLPTNARTPGPLRNALLAISTRHLFSNAKCRSETGVIQWRGRMLPELTEDFAMSYHSKCAQQLIRLARDPMNLHDKTLLAAVLILHADEELKLKTPEEKDDQQLFSKTSSLLINAQFLPSPATPHESSQPSSIVNGENAKACLNTLSSTNQSNTGPGLRGLSTACFWMTLRQSSYVSFLKRQPIRFPLLRCDALRQFHPASDFIWAQRIIVLYADVLEFCYGSQSIDGDVDIGYIDQARWQELESREKSLCTSLPRSFEPTYFCQPDLTHGNAFPTTLFSELHHVGGITYLELARLLLFVHDPARPRLGARFMPATDRLVSRTKAILSRLCGIALGNSDCLQGLLNACLGIVMFGEIFNDVAERDALLDVLSMASIRFACTTDQIAATLQAAWHGSEDSSMSRSDYVKFSLEDH